MKLSMNDHKKVPKIESEEKKSHSYAGPIMVVTAIAAYGLMKRGNYSAALELYKRGGGGFNLYRTSQDAKPQRFFGIDYHPIPVDNSNKPEWRLHAHYGPTKEDISKHRPYEGGWKWR